MSESNNQSLICLESSLVVLDSREGVLRGIGRDLHGVLGRGLPEGMDRGVEHNMFVDAEIINSKGKVSFAAGNGENTIYVSVKKEKEIATEHGKKIRQHINIYSFGSSFSSMSSATLGYPKTGSLKQYLKDGLCKPEKRDWFTGEPIRIIFPSPNVEIIQISSSPSHTLALDSNCDVWGWGSSGFGQLGVNEEDVYWPRLVRGGVSDIAAGIRFSLLVEKAFPNKVLSFGDNTNFCLGRNVERHEWESVKLPPNSSSSPLPVMEGGCYVSAGPEIAAVIDINGRLYVWGEPETQEQLGCGTDVVRVERPKLIMAEGNPGTCWRQVRFTNSSAAAIALNRELFVWGDGPALGLEGRRVAKPLSVGNGTMSAMGVGFDMLVTRDDAGILRTAGVNRGGRLALMSTAVPLVQCLTPVGQLMGGGEHPHSEDAGIGTGRLRANADVDVKERAKLQIVICGDKNRTFLVTDKLTLWQLGQPLTGPSIDDPDVPKQIRLTGVEQIELGATFLIIRTSDGRIYSLGEGAYGQLGLGVDIRISSTPTNIVVGVRGWTAIAVAATKRSAAALLRNPGTGGNELYVWGDSPASGEIQWEPTAVLDDEGKNMKGTYLAGGENILVIIGSEGPIVFCPKLELFSLHLEVLRGARIIDVKCGSESVFFLDNDGLIWVYGSSILFNRERPEEIVAVSEYRRHLKFSSSPSDKVASLGQFSSRCGLLNLKSGRQIVLDFVSGLCCPLINFIAPAIMTRASKAFLSDVLNKRTRPFSAQGIEDLKDEDRLSEVIGVCKMSGSASHFAVLSEDGEVLCTWASEGGHSKGLGTSLGARATENALDPIDFSHVLTATKDQRTRRCSLVVNAGDVSRKKGNFITNGGLLRPSSSVSDELFNYIPIPISLTDLNAMDRSLNREALMSGKSTLIDLLLLWSEIHGNGDGVTIPSYIIRRGIALLLTGTDLRLTCLRQTLELEADVHLRISQVATQIRDTFSYGGFKSDANNRALLNNIQTLQNQLSWKGTKSSLSNFIAKSVEVKRQVMSKMPPDEVVQFVSHFCEILCMQLDYVLRFFTIAESEALERLVASILPTTESEIPEMAALVRRAMLLDLRNASHEPDQFVLFGSRSKSIHARCLTPVALAATRTTGRQIYKLLIGKNSSCFAAIQKLYESGIDLPIQNPMCGETENPEISAQRMNTILIHLMSIIMVIANQPSMQLCFAALLQTLRYPIDESSLPTGDITGEEGPHFLANIGYTAALKEEWFCDWLAKLLTSAVGIPVVRDVLPLIVNEAIHENIDSDHQILLPILLDQLNIVQDLFETLCERTEDPTPVKARMEASWLDRLADKMREDLLRSIWMHPKFCCSLDVGNSLGGFLRRYGFQDRQIGTEIEALVNVNDVRDVVEAIGDGYELSLPLNDRLISHVADGPIWKDVNRKSNNTVRLFIDTRTALGLHEPLESSEVGNYVPSSLTLGVDRTLKEAFSDKMARVAKPWLPIPSFRQDIRSVDGMICSAGSIDALLDVIAANPKGFDAACSKLPEDDLSQASENWIEETITAVGSCEIDRRVALRFSHVYRTQNPFLLWRAVLGRVWARVWHVEQLDLHLQLLTAAETAFSAQAKVVEAGGEIPGMISLRSPVRTTNIEGDPTYSWTTDAGQCVCSCGNDLLEVIGTSRNPWTVACAKTPSAAFGLFVSSNPLVRWIPELLGTELPTALQRPINLQGRVELPPNTEDDEIEEVKYKRCCFCFKRRKKM